MSRKLTERFIFIALLVFVTTVIIYAPLRYGFNYPIGGHDAAPHIHRLTALAQNPNIFEMNFNYYGIILLIPFTLLGINPVTVVSVFYYTTIIGVFIAMWILLRRFYGLLPAMLGFYVSVFMVYGIWKNFDDGMVFNIFNLWVVTPMAFYALCSWLESGQRKWLGIAGLLFVCTSLIHNSTYLFILVSIPFFTVIYGIYQWKIGNNTMVVRLLSFSGVFTISILTAWFTWMQNLLPRLVGLSIDSVSTGQPSRYEWITPFIWVHQHINPGTIVLFLLAILLLMLIFKQGKREDKQKVFDKLNQPLTYILIAFLPFLTIGSFTLLGYDYGRFARDQVTFLGIIVAVLLGVALSHYKLPSIRAWILIVAFVMITSNTPVYNWLNDHTALRPADEQAIQYLNEITSEPIVVLHFAKLAPWMYDIYTDENVSYQRIFNLDDYEQADYIIYRSKHMTHYTKHVSRPDDFELTLTTFKLHPELAEMARFISDDVLIVIYKKLN